MTALPRGRNTSWPVAAQWGIILAALLSAQGARANNPVLQGADPHAMFIGDELWIFPTGGPGKNWGPTRLGAWSSRDLKSWKGRGELIRQDRIGWIGDDGARRHHLWAPAVLERKGRWYLYYSVGPQSPTPSRIGVATASRPQGPYKDNGQPLLTGGKGFEAIDPMVFVDPRSRKTYLYAGGSAGARLRIFELSRDLLSVRREIAIKQPQRFTEGAFMHERNGIYYLSYSHGRWKSPSYSVHYSTAPSPVGPWTYRGAILTGDERHQGPGHHSFVRDPRTGQWLIVYHRWDIPRGKPLTGRRKIAIEKIGYARDGTIKPIVMTNGAASPTR